MTPRVQHQGRAVRVHAELEMPPRPDTARLSVRVRMDPLHFAVRLMCAAPDTNGIVRRRSRRRRRRGRRCGSIRWSSRPRCAPRRRYRNVPESSDVSDLHRW